LRHRPVANFEDGVGMAPFAPSTSSSATQGDAFEQLQGKRILQLNNYFIFDYADKLKLAHQAVDSQFCEYAASRGVIVDVMLSGYDEKELIRTKQPQDVMRPCLGKLIICASAPMDCYKERLADVKYDAVWTRDDDVNYAAHEIALKLGLPSIFNPKLPMRTHEQLTSKGQNELLLGKHAARWIKDCKQPDDLVYPGFIRYAKGVHATGGWGAQCLRHMSSVRSKEEMARKLPFLCGEGMGSYSVLREAGARELYYTPLNVGIELYAEVIVYKGRSTIIYQSGGYSCAGRMVHMFPGWWPGFDAPAAKAQCDALVRKVVKTMRVHNHILGVQMMFDWRKGKSFGCKFTEANLRPHDWKILSDPGFGWRHFERLFDYGAVGLSLAFGVDPTPLIAEVPKAFHSAFASVCPLNLTGPGGFMDHGDLYKLWMAGSCYKIAVRPTSAQAFEDIRHDVPCKEGPSIYDVTPKLKARCTTEIGQNWFWWTDSDLLLADIKSLSMVADEQNEGSDEQTLVEPAPLSNKGGGGAADKPPKEGAVGALSQADKANLEQFLFSQAASVAEGEGDDDDDGDDEEPNAKEGARQSVIDKDGS